MSHKFFVALVFKVNQCEGARRLARRSKSRRYVLKVLSSNDGANSLPLLYKHRQDVDGKAENAIREVVVIERKVI